MGFVGIEEKTNYKAERETEGVCTGLLGCGENADLRGRHLNTPFATVSPFIPSRSLKRPSKLRAFLLPFAFMVFLIGWILSCIGDSPKRKRRKRQCA